MRVEKPFIPIWEKYKLFEPVKLFEPAWVTLEKKYNILKKVSFGYGYSKGDGKVAVIPSDNKYRCKVDWKGKIYFYTKEEKPMFALANTIGMMMRDNHKDLEKFLEIV